MVSNLRLSEIPRDRTDVLHILRQHNDDINDLSPAQIAAIRALYHLDDNRSVADRLRDGSLILTSQDLSGLDYTDEGVSDD
jgi:hypothetical protein